jgi:hypothetical protein
MRMDFYSELDPNLIEQWNQMYDTYGYLMDDFKEKWEKEQLKGEHKFKPLNKIEELKERIPN